MRTFTHKYIPTCIPINRYMTGMEMGNKRLLSVKDATTGELASKPFKAKKPIRTND